MLLSLVLSATTVPNPPLERDAECLEGVGSSFTMPRLSPADLKGLVPGGLDLKSPDLGGALP
jgi:hypothetical protein